MPQSNLNRRQLLKVAGVSAGLSLLPRLTFAAPKPIAKNAFTYCLNMATIRGHKLGFVKELETASKAGFTAVEIWIDSLQTYLENGGKLSEAKQRLDDLGVQVANTIAFASWIVEDEGTRSKAVEQMKKEMDWVAQLGCKRIAATAGGATDGPVLEPKAVASRYRTILELGDKTGVVPQLEMWGFSKNLSRVSDVMYVALESGHPSARLLLDVFHLYKGGSPIDTLSLVGKKAVEVFHMNDYPSTIPAATITDADRIYPGDGVAPISRILETLYNPAQPIFLSLEVFNKNYYSQDALTVAKTGLAKLKAATARLKI